MFKSKYDVSQDDFIKIAFNTLLEARKSHNLSEVDIKIPYFLILSYSLIKKDKDLNISIEPMNLKVPSVLSSNSTYTYTFSNIAKEDNNKLNTSSTSFLLASLLTFNVNNNFKNTLKAYFLEVLLFYDFFDLESFLRYEFSVSTYSNSNQIGIVTDSMFEKIAVNMKLKKKLSFLKVKKVIKEILF